MTSTVMLPNGVTVAQLILVQFVEVRILIGQPFLSLVELSNSLKLNLKCPSFSSIILSRHVVRNCRHKSLLLWWFLPVFLIQEFVFPRRALSSDEKRFWHDKMFGLSNKCPQSLDTQTLSVSVKDVHYFPYIWLSAVEIRGFSVYIKIDRHYNLLSFFVVIKQ